ncbi:MAG: retron system putative HNH endonuclease [Desulfobacteraceae bacterium]
MRTVQKNQSPVILQKEQQKTPPATRRDAENRWKRFRGTRGKNQVRSSLLDEQWWLCAYTEIALASFAHGCHIEHIEPKGMNPARTFDYHNMVVSVLDSDSLQTFVKKDRFGGHFKQKQYDPALFVSPLETDAGIYFDYLSNGEVAPASALNSIETRRADYTIRLLNLNAPYLVNERRRWLEEIDQEIDRLLNDPNALRLLAECELCDTGGILRQFHTAATVRFGRIGQQVMDEICPACSNNAK